MKDPKSTEIKDRKGVFINNPKNTLMVQKIVLIKEQKSTLIWDPRGTLIKD